MLMRLRFYFISTNFLEILFTIFIMNTINKLLFIISGMYWYCYSKLELFSSFLYSYCLHYFSLLQNFFSTYIYILKTQFSYYYSNLLEFTYSFESASTILNNINKILYYLSSLGILNVISVLLPVLLAVAFMTIIERKQLAAMQRRVGPNTVGQIKIKNSSFKRSYHSFNQDNLISELSLNRKAPIKPFNEKIVSVCEDLTSSIALNIFFKNLKDKSGIYMFTYKIDTSI